MPDSLGVALEEFYEEQTYKGNSSATVLYYRTNVAHYLKDANVTTLENFTTASVRSWLVRHAHLSSTTLRTYDRSLRVVANWLHRRGYLAKNPLADLPKPKATQPVIATLTAADLAAMFVEARRRRNPLRDAALLTLLIDTGVRVGEATSLHLHSVDWAQGSVSVTGKTGARIVPFGRQTKRALRQYIDGERCSRAPAQRAVFLTRTGDALTSHAATQLVRKLATAAGITTTKLGPHTFRHTYSVEFVRAGGDAFTLQRLLGHSTLDMTRRYVHLAETDLRTAHKRFSPADRLL